MDWRKFFHADGKRLSNLRQASIKQILPSYRSATVHDPQWWKAWHTFALATFEVANVIHGEHGLQEGGVPGAVLASYAVQAIEGKNNAISRSSRH